MCVDCCKGLHHRNITWQLRHREYSFLPNSRLNMRVMRSLVCQKEAKFKCVWKKRATSPIAYEDGHLYFDNYKVCYTTRGRMGLPHLLYTLPPCPTSQKVQDGLVCQCPLAELPKEHRGWRPHFLALTAHNWLVRHDLRTGEILQQIYLSRHYKFRHISWDVEQTRVILKSTHIQKPTVVNQNALLALAVFTIFPLQFVGLLEVTRSVFGSSLVDAMISQGALITMHQGGQVRIHSLDDVLSAGLLFSAQLHQYCPSLEGIAGSYPSGVPLNVKLRVAPPVLFEVRCADHSLTLGGVPWHYVISTCGTSGNFKVYNLETKQMAEGGCLDMAKLSVEPDKCIFHADDSGRILHIGSDEIRVLQIREIDSTGCHKVALEYTVLATSLNQETNNGVKEDKVRFSSSGRSIRRSSTYNDSISGLQESIAGVDYENDLDILVVTSTYQDGDVHRGTVHLLDNDVGDVICDVPLEEPWREFCEHTIVLDIDLIVHIVKGPTRKFECAVYQLNRAPDDSEQTTSRPKTRQNISRRRSTRR